MLLLLCAAALLAGFAIGGHWPLVGDSILMHYVVWLTQHGFAPYRDIAEMNLPFTYMSERLAMTVFGTGDIGWRVYDGALMLATVYLSWRLLREHGAAAGVFAATMFAAVHLQDGVHMAGQRDLLVTVLEAGAGVALLRTWPAVTRPASPENAPDTRMRSVLLWAVVAGMLGAAAACIKPPALLFPVAAILWRTWPGGGSRPGRAAGLAGAFVGALVPCLACLAYLHHYGAVAAFVQDLHGLIAYHASIERRSFGFLLTHASSPVLLFLLVSLLAFVWLRGRAEWTRVDVLCAIGAATGLLSYCLQGKGFPYQRYPLLLWLLLLCTSRLWAGARQNGKARIAFGVPVVTGLALTAMFLMRGTHFQHVDPYADLRSDLRAQNAAAADGAVQCLDTAGPCIGALYKERLTESTGFLYDCYLLDGGNAVVRQQRALFMQEWNRRTPEVVVLTDSNCFTGPRTFDKFSTWPWMQQQLSRYALVLERHPEQPLRFWSRPERPYAYRILRRRPAF